jgi:hypothetical protein
MFLNELLDLNEAGSMIHWDYGDEDVNKTLMSLIKYNNGLWKSAKQRDYLTGPKGPMGGDFKNNGHQRRDYEFMDTHFGVKMDKKKDQYAIHTGGYVRWADYGSKSARSIGFYYVMDNLGVVAKYKLGWKYVGTSAGIDKAKTKLEWERPAKVDTSALETSEKEAKKSAEEKEKAAASTQYVGTPGEWIDDIKVKIEKIVDLGAGDYGERYMTVIKDDSGNTYNYFGWPKVSESGHEEIYKQDYVMRAKVKKHYVNKNNVKVTVLGYPKFRSKK